ncbi:MAG: hypothetical protein DRQ13_08365 [Ignavibacteriae bacterium]|nr:MAG: hypothetical protein DRQ13_08365 [Ignavibacteriota bacterium]
MKIINRVAAVVAILIGGMAIVAGTKILTGFSIPEYEFFNSLVIYNVVMGLISLFAGYLIWKNFEWALPLSALITGLHIIVLALLLTAFSDIISSHSINAMLFRSGIWLVILFIMWISESKRKRSEALI